MAIPGGRTAVLGIRWLGDNALKSAGLARKSTTGPQVRPLIRGVRP